MKNLAMALKTYFSGFGLPAYTTDSVPDDVELPYLAYSLAEPEWNQKATMYVQIWNRSRSNAMILEKADEILADIGEGKRLETDAGIVVIWPDSPAQVQVDEDPDFRYAYINFGINSYQMPGS